jgi:hypothetical protein
MYHTNLNTAALEWSPMDGRGHLDEDALPRRRERRDDGDDADGGGQRVAGASPLGGGPDRVRARKAT